MKQKFSGTFAAALILAAMTVAAAGAFAQGTDTGASPSPAPAQTEEKKPEAAKPEVKKTEKPAAPAKRKATVKTKPAAHVARVIVRPAPAAKSAQEPVTLTQPERQETKTGAPAAAATATARATASEELFGEKKKPALKSPANGKKFIVLVADKINIKELNDPGAFPNFHRAARLGSLGLMVTGGNRSLDTAGAYATIGAGGYVTGAPGAGKSYNINRLKPMENGQTVYEAYLSRTAGVVPRIDSDTVLHLALPPLMRANRKRSPQPGALGEILWKNGYSSCVYGNADFDGVPHREVALITMNSRGQTPHGDVDQTGIADVRSKAPFAAAPDMDKLKDAFYEIYLRDRGETKPYLCDFIVIDFGDTSRAEAFRSQAEEVTASSKKRQALERLDDFLGYVMDASRLDTMEILLVSPSPPEENFSVNESMTPILAVGGHIDHGLLTSSTTRGKGIVSNLDIAPTVLSYFGIPVPAEMIGSPLRSIAGGDAVPALLRTQFIDAMRLRMGRMQQAALFLALLVTALSFFTALRMPKVLREWQATLGAALCFCAALFPALLLSSVIFTRVYDTLPGGFNYYVLYFGGCALVVGGIGALLPRAQWRALWFVVVYVLIISIDILYGGFFSRDSVMASSPQLVLRFYGVESALAGLLIGAVLAGCGLCLDISKEKFRAIRWPLLALMAGVAALIGTPALGANTGCLLAACVAFASFSLLMFRRRYRWTEALATVGIAVLLFAIFAAVGAAVSRGAHLPFSRTLTQARLSGDIQALPRIALWRIASNLRLLREGGAWSVFFAGFAACGATLAFFPNNRMESLFRRFRRLNYALLASLAGAGAAFALIYPGVVPAAGMLFIPVIATLMLCINPSKKTAEKELRHDKPYERKPRFSAKPQEDKTAAEKPVQPEQRQSAPRQDGRNQSSQGQGGRNQNAARQEGQRRQQSGGGQSRPQQAQRPATAGNGEKDKGGKEGEDRNRSRGSRGGGSGRPSPDGARQERRPGDGQSKGAGGRPFIDRPHQPKKSLEEFLAPGAPPPSKPNPIPFADGDGGHPKPQGSRNNRRRGGRNRSGGDKRLPPNHPDKGGDKQ